MLAQSDFVHDYPEDLYWETLEAPTEDLKGKETYYSFHLPGEFDRIKGLTAIILKDSLNQKELPRMERREGKDWIGLRVYNRGKVTDLYINQLADGRLMHSNSWIEVDGWTTDAYLFAVTYEEGTDLADAHDFFLCYGSALRRGTESYFSSLSKLFVVQQKNGRSLDLWMEGQPKMNASLRATKRPEALRLNGEIFPVTYEKGHLRLKACFR